MFPVHCVKDTEGSKVIDGLEVSEGDKIIVASFDEEAHEFALKEMENTLGCNII